MEIVSGFSPDWEDIDEVIEVMSTLVVDGPGSGWSVTTGGGDLTTGGVSLFCGFCADGATLTVL